MKVFISWSGERSKRVAELLKWWLKCVIQAVDPWISSQDIDRGALWFNEINDRLANTVIGVVCLTKDNRDKPWILFETGALAKGLSSNKVCPFLIDLQPKDLEPPLSQFNATLPDKEGLLSLVTTINLELKEKALDKQVLTDAFETFWPRFDAKFNDILNSTDEGEMRERSTKDILNEVLTTVRELEKRNRRTENHLVSPSTLKYVFNDKFDKLNLSKYYLLVEQAKTLLSQQLSNDEILEKLSGIGHSRKAIHMALADAEKALKG